MDGKYMPFDEKLKAQGLKPSLRVALSVALYLHDVGFRLICTSSAASTCRRS